LYLRGGLHAKSGLRFSIRDDVHGEPATDTPLCRSPRINPPEWLTARGIMRKKKKFQGGAIPRSGLEEPRKSIHLCGVARGGVRHVLVEAAVRKKYLRLVRASGSTEGRISQKIARQPRFRCTSSRQSKKKEACRAEINKTEFLHSSFSGGIGAGIFQRGGGHYTSGGCGYGGGETEVRCAQP